MSSRPDRRRAPSSSALLDQRATAGPDREAMVDPDLDLDPDLDRPLHVVGLPDVLRHVARACAVLSIAIGAVVLFGYLARWAAAVELYRTLPPMYPNAALGFVIGGGSALVATSPQRGRQRLAVVGFSVVLAVAALTFVLHLLDAGPTVLEGLWPDDPFITATTAIAGRPVVETCVAFMGVGASGILLATRGSARWSQGLALGGVSVGAAAVLGYIIGVDRQGLGSSFVVVGMALHTGIALTLLGLAVLLARPTVGLFARLTHAGPSARLSRRLVAVVVFAPIVLTASSALLQRAMPDSRLVQSTMAVAQVLALGLLVMLPLAAADDVEQRAERTLREARAVRERAGEQDVISAAIVDLLLERPPTPPGWEVGFRQTAAFAALPGDSCQVLLADRGFLVAVVDVAGHGTGPALQALRLRFEIAALWQSGLGVAAIADQLARSVTEMSTIATGVLLAVDADGAECEYVNAGHPAVIAVTGASTDTWGRTAPLFGLGAAEHRPQRRALGRGALLTIYTDGIIESRSPSSSLLGSSAIEHAIRVHGPAGPQAVADACIDAALAHANTRLRDDALALVLRCT
ncbi:MAG: PP2C family protein-serine/threonine phosphatase [Actinobacteria bacterium]|nr:PP2C family protein-serine/threonine phosphatase [Actinomycetota bacterium]